MKNRKAAAVVIFVAVFLFLTLLLGIIGAIPLVGRALSLVVAVILIIFVIVFFAVVGRKKK